MNFSSEGKCTVKRILRKKEYFAPRIIIKLSALLKMKGYVEHCDNEIAWLGLVEKDGTTYTIVDVDLMQQDVSSATAEIHEKGLQEYAERFISKGDFETLSKIRLWGHSHVNMDTTPSSTDEETFEEYGENCEYFIRIIANKKGKLTVDFVDMIEDLRFDNVPWEVEYPDDIVDLLNRIDETKDLLSRLEKKLAEYQEAMYTAIENDVKASIKKHVTEYKYSGKVYNVKDYNKKWSYNDDNDDDDDDDDDYTCLSTNYRNDYDVTIYSDSGTVVQQCHLCDLLTEFEIISIAENCTNIYQLKTYLKDRNEFANYDDVDWEILRETIDDYYLDLYGGC
jgi:hypothetical protein